MKTGEILKVLRGSGGQITSACSFFQKIPQKKLNSKANKNKFL
jgi:hypothetical protein